MLSVEGLRAAYGSAQVLFDVSFALAEGEAISLLGRNGMGKTTTISAVMGLVPAVEGRVTFAGQDILRRPAHRVARSGLGLVPEGRQIFPTLTVEENLIATAAARFGRPRWTLQEVYAMFPRLAERRRHMGDQLSGGEQQMLAIGRGLMTNPRLLILDEATEGLAPLIRGEIWQCLAHLKGEGQTMLIVDKHVDALSKIADRHVILEKGRTVWTGTPAELHAGVAVRERYLRV